MRRVTLILLLTFAAVLIWLSQPQSSMNSIRAPDFAELTAEILPTLIVLPFLTPTRDPQTYHIVYLLAPDAVPSDSVLSPDTFNQFASVLTAHTWDEVLNYEVDEPIEALIVHQSAIDLVDYDWTAQTARRGLVIAVINMGQGTLKRLFGSQCHHKAPEVPPEYIDQDFWMESVELTRFIDPADRDRWYEAKYVACKKLKTLAMYQFDNQWTLAGAADVDYLMHFIIDDIDQANDWNARTEDWGATVEHTTYSPTATPGK